MGTRGPTGTNAERSAGWASNSHRRAASVAFRREQLARCFDPHVAPLNRLVDDLTAQVGGLWMPYVAPYHGGTASKLLLLFQDPGRMTSPDCGSGLIGCENDDPSAELLALCLDEAGLRQADVVPWNSYPWFIPAQSGVTSAMRDAGLAPLRRVLEVLPEVHTVVTFGAVAHDTGLRFAGRYPSASSRLRWLRTFHTSGRGVTNGGQQKRAEGISHIVATLRQAAVKV